MPATVICIKLGCRVCALWRKQLPNLATTTHSEAINATNSSVCGGVLLAKCMNVLVRLSCALSQSIGRLLIGVPLFAQFAVASDAYPGLKSLAMAPRR